MSREELNAKLGLDEEQMDSLGCEYEDDSWDATHLGKVVMGRPSLADEEVRSVTFKLPASKVIAIDRRAAAKGETRSQALRDAVDDYLMQA